MSAVVTITRLGRSFFLFFNDTATTEIYTLSLHDALPISTTFATAKTTPNSIMPSSGRHQRQSRERIACRNVRGTSRSEEHTSELQSRQYLVCRLLLEKKINTSFSVRKGL